MSLEPIREAPPVDMADMALSSVAAILIARAVLAFLVLGSSSALVSFLPVRLLLGLLLFPLGLAFALALGVGFAILLGVAFPLPFPLAVLASKSLITD